MKVIVGLGNPGYKYRNNRHNVGQMFVDYVDKIQNDNTKVKITKTTVFMNQSGAEIKKLLKIANSKIENLLIVHDDLDIPLGKFKINKGSGPKLHNGINSIEQALGTKDFWRVRIGVDARTQTNWIDGETYVLQNFGKEEKEKVYAIFPVIYQRLTNIIES